MLHWFNNLSNPQQILIIYLAAINIVTFFYFGIDKIKSQLNSRRVSEKTLWLLSLIGGSLGAMAGMRFFRHKTKKVSFQIILGIILLAQIFLTALMM